MNLNVPSNKYFEKSRHHTNKIKNFNTNEQNNLKSKKYMKY